MIRSSCLSSLEWARLSFSFQGQKSWSMEKSKQSLTSISRPSLSLINDGQSLLDFLTKDICRWRLEKAEWRSCKNDEYSNISRCGNLELEGKKGRIDKFGQEVSIGWLHSSLTLKDIAAFYNLLWGSSEILLMLKRTAIPTAYMQKAGDTWDISPQIFLDFRLRTRNQYCTQAIAWGSTI